MNNSKEIYRQIQEINARYSRNKLKRSIILFLVYFGLMFVVLFLYDNTKELMEIVYKAFLATLAILFANFTVFSQMHDLSRNESSHLMNLQIKYQDIIDEEEGLFGDN